MAQQPGNGTVAQAHQTPDGCLATRQLPHRTSSNGSGHSNLTFTSTYSSDSSSYPESLSHSGAGVGLGSDRQANGGAFQQTREGMRSAMRSQTLPLEPEGGFSTLQYAQQQGGPVHQQPQWSAPQGEFPVSFSGFIKGVSYALAASFELGRDVDVSWASERGGELGSWRRGLSGAILAHAEGNEPGGHCLLCLKENHLEDLPKPRPPGLYAQHNHSTPTLAYPSAGDSPPLDVGNAPPVPAMDDINLGLENMRFEQRGRDSAPSMMAGTFGGRQSGSRHSDSQAVGQDGAMEIRGKEGNTASVYSVDSGFSHASGSGSGGRDGRRESQTSLRNGGESVASIVDGYADDGRRHSSGSTYLPYDQASEYGDYPDQMRPQQGQHHYQDAGPGQPYYAQGPLQNQHPNQHPSHPPHPHPQHQPHSYGGPSQQHYAPHPQQHPQQYQQLHHPQPSFQPQPPHGGWGYDYSAAAAQNPYYAAATGQLGFPDGAAHPNGGGPNMNPYPLGRALSSASSMTSLAPSTGSGNNLSRSASSLNVTNSQPPTGRRAPVNGPPITKASVDEYRNRIKADPDPEAQFNFAKYLIEAAKKISSSASGDEKSAKKYRDALLAESLKLIKRLATQGTGLGKPAYADAQFFLANCLGNGSLGLQVDHEKAYNLYVQASKQNHSSATYRTAVCNEVGAGTRRDHARAVLFYRKASALGDTAGMYKLGMILLNGLLGQQRNVKEAVAWLKRAATQADEDNPHALHELGLLYEKAPPPGQPGPLASIIPFDPAQARELFTQAGQFGYPPSQFKLGSCYEYGTLTCPVDPRRSIAWYTRAAERGDAEAELALSGWYLTGSEGVLKQSDSEAYLWARRAANKGLPKAEYAVGYYSEVGIGVKQDLEEAKRWYMRAAAQGNKRAMQRLSELRELTKKDGKAKPKERESRKR
ncbi:uncharacterized protein P7C70_g5611, partial [Phenoliferia sp. Uapishka_3]